MAARHSNTIFNSMMQSRYKSAIYIPQYAIQIKPYFTIQYNPPCTMHGATWPTKFKSHLCTVTFCSNTSTLWYALCCTLFPPVTQSLSLSLTHSAQRSTRILTPTHYYSSSSFNVFSFDFKRSWTRTRNFIFRNFFFLVFRIFSYTR